MVISTPLARRRGLTLVEALVAMFVAALAMISLLALFPLGALQMAQALKDARCTEAATNADAILRDHWRTNVVEVQSPLPPDGFAGLLANPVFIDPIGANSGAPLTVGGQATLIRQNLTVPNSPTTRTPLTFTQSLRMCSLLDDLNYDLAGAPVRTGGTGPIERAGRYNWMAVLQATGSGLGAVDMKILVFDGRAPGFNAPNAERTFPNPPSPPPMGSPPLSVTFTVGSTVLTIPYDTTFPPPLLRKGRWLMLSTTNFQLGGPAPVPLSPSQVGFYRVVSVDDQTPGQMVVELQAPVRPVHQLNGTNATVATVFAGLAEVFERPQLTAQ